MGKDLGNGIHKMRLAIKSKGRGKRAGARMISHSTIMAKVVLQKK